MSAPEVAAFLAEPRTLNIGTIGPDGAIHLVAMWFVMQDESPVFWTYAKSQKVHNLRRDPRMSGLVEAGESYDSLRGVELIGSARFITDQDQVLEIGRALSAKYAGRNDPGDVVAAAAKRVAIALDPARVISWDHRKLAVAK